jgi:hypothetical protein
LGVPAGGERGVGRPTRVALPEVACYRRAVCRRCALFEAMREYFRHETAGLGHPYRQGDAYRRFIDAARVGLQTLYGVVAALTGGLAYIANRRVDGGTAVLTTAAVLLFIFLTQPLVEFLSASFLGESFFRGLWHASTERCRHGPAC